MGEAERVVANAIAAHGGEAFWNSLSAIEAVLSVDGFLFTAKRIPALRRQRVLASTSKPQLSFLDWPEPGQRGEWIGEEEVRIVTTEGTVLANRSQPRSAFHGLRRELWWDDLDFLYFAGYATWNYLTTPFLFLQPGFSFTELPAGPEGTLRIKACFPPEASSHCREQVFHFTPGGDLLRLDYTAEVVGGWAHAAHLCSDYRDFDGLRAPIRRRVQPLFNLANPLPFPTLVAIDVHELRPIARAA